MSTLFTIQDVSRRSGLSEPALRYYEQFGLIGPIARDAGSGHRRYREDDLDTLWALACLRAKAALWDARDCADTGAEAEAYLQMQKVVPRLERMVLR
jgi:DNA-binding transcriptional MerR regulator